jgi:hypothetical protein
MTRQVQPTLQDGRYVLELGAGGGVVGELRDVVRFEADARLGGRITALSLDGRNLLTGPEVDSLNFGSTFWTSPQEHWGWPPPVAIDSGPYEAALDGATIVMAGPSCPALRVAIEKRFSADAARGAFTLEYRIHNRSSAAVRLAPWEVTRVRPNGLTFFAPASAGYPPSDLPVADAHGITWFSHEIDKVGGHQKLFADAAEGWIAHVDGDALLLKTFALAPRAAHAPGEAQIEIYASTEHRYVEVEQQGAYEIIPPGESLAWPVEWRVRRLPPDVPRAPGNPKLAAFARVIAAGGSR